MGLTWICTCAIYIPVMQNFVHIIAEIVVSIVAHLLNGARRSRAEREGGGYGVPSRRRRARDNGAAGVDASEEESNNARN